MEEVRQEEILNHAAKWPYGLAVASCTLALLGFAFAPISGIVYIGLPATGLAAYWAWTHHSVARTGLTLSVSLFGIGFVLGVLGLTLTGVGEAGNNFLFGEVGFSLAAAALMILPSTAALTGLVFAIKAVSRPGQRIPRPEPV